MTAQISNVFIFEDKEYDIIGISNEIEFSPRDYGLKPVAPHTAAWKGYYYEANVIDNNLVVENLHVNDYEGNYPEINGIKAIDESLESSFFTYYNVDIPLYFTGKILLGHDFIRKYYEHMGYQKPHGYIELIMLTFSNGELIEKEDLSKRAENMRLEIDEDPESFYKGEKSNLIEYIEKSYSLDIEKEFL